MIWKIWMKCEMICKIWRKSKLKSEKIWKIWKIWKTSKWESEKIWKIWKISVLVIITPKDTSSSSTSTSSSSSSSVSHIKFVFHCPMFNCYIIHWFAVLFEIFVWPLKGPLKYDGWIHDVTSCLLWRHRWMTLYAKPINRPLALERWFEKPKTGSLDM